MNTETRDFLQSLADKLGITVDKVYGVLVKQAKIDAVISIVILALLFILLWGLAIGWEHIIPYCKPINPNGQYSFDLEWPDWVQITFMLLLIASLAAAIGTVFHFISTVEDTLTGFLNPEAKAVEKILNSIQK